MGSNVNLAHFRNRDILIQCSASADLPQIAICKDPSGNVFYFCHTDRPQEPKTHMIVNNPYDSVYVKCEAVAPGETTESSTRLRDGTLPVGQIAVVEAEDGHGGDQDYNDLVVVFSTVP